MLIANISSATELNPPKFYQAKKSNEEILIIPSFHSSGRKINWSKIYKEILTKMDVDVVFFELDGMINNINIEENQKWHPNQLKIITPKLQAIGMTSRNIENIGPHLGFFIYSEMRKNTLGITPQNGLDFYIYTHFKNKKTKIKYLENINNFKDSISRNISSKEMGDLIFKLSNVDDNYFINEDKKLADYFEKNEGNIRSACENMREEAGSNFYKSVILERNKKFIEKIQHENSKKILIIIGACHLYGRGSVIDLLRNRGYSVNAE